jgi:hypothetical protein
VPKMKVDVGETLVQTAHDVEDEGTVMNGFAKVPESVSHPFELVAVVGDGEIALAKVVKFRVEEEGPSPAVPKELRLNGKPGDAANSVADEDCISEVSGDGADNPRLDDVVHANPVRGSGREVVGEDMVLQGVLADGEEEEVVPPGVEHGKDVQNHRDESPNVLDDDCLSVEIDERGCLMDEKSNASIRNCKLGVEVRLVRCDVVVGNVVEGVSRGTSLSDACQGVADVRIGSIVLPGSISGLALNVTSARKSGCACELRCLEALGFLRAGDGGNRVGLSAGGGTRRRGLGRAVGGRRPWSSAQVQQL